MSRPSPVSCVPALLLALSCHTAKIDTTDTHASADSETPRDSQDTAPGGDSPTDTQDTAHHPELFAPVSGVSVQVNPNVLTILEVTWTQDADADTAWLEFSFENDQWFQSPATPRAEGQHTEAILGVPGDTDLEFRIVNEIDGNTLYSRETYSGTTGPIPADLVPPTLNSYDPHLADGARYMLGSIDVSTGWYGGPCWVFIVDRQGRYVWYYEVSDSRLSLFPQVSADGTHILFEGTTNYVWTPGVYPSVYRSTLDQRFFQEYVLPDMGFSFDEIDGERILYNKNESNGDDVLAERQPDGTERTVWNCSDWMESVRGTRRGCSVNSVIWAPDMDAVLWSMYTTDTVVEVDRETGDFHWYAGQIDGGWDFDPQDSLVDYQHYPNYSPEGNLMVSTHILGESGQQRARELVVDWDTQTMIDVWNYGEGVDEYATYGGEAIRLDNGNTLICYGTGGSIREVTRDKEIAWNIQWVSGSHSHLLGHNTLMDDLYALNRGPEGG